MPIDPRDLTRDGRPVGWSQNKQYVDALNNSSGPFGCLGGLFVLACVALVIGIVAFFAGRIWDFLTTWKPSEGTYAAPYQIGDSNTALDHIVVADDTITFYLKLQPKSDADPRKASTILCPTNASPANGFGENVRITAEHIWNVYKPDVLLPTTWECQGKEGRHLTYAAGEPMIFWAGFPLKSQFDLKLSVGLRIGATTDWTSSFQIDDLRRG